VLHNYVYAVSVGLLEDLLEAGMAVVLGRFYWTICSAVEQKVPFSVVITADWDCMIADTVKTSLSPAFNTLCCFV